MIIRQMQVINGEYSMQMKDDYIHYEYAPKTTNYIVNKKNGDYTFLFSDVALDYTGIADIDDNIGSKWLSLIWPSEDNDEDSRAIAYLLDISIWNPIYKNEYAEYAIGAPTLEMFCKSYRDIFSERYIECSSNQRCILVWME